jgi:hypothetical protein
MTMHCPLTHSSQLVQLFLAKHRIPQKKELPFSPDITPSDFLLLPEFKETFKHKIFVDVKTIEHSAMKQLNNFYKILTMVY